MDLTSRKRKHGKSLTVDIGDVTFVINRSIRQCIFDFETSVCPESRSTAKSLLAEFSLMEIFPNDDLVTFYSSWLVTRPILTMQMIMVSPLTGDVEARQLA